MKKTVILLVCVGLIILITYIVSKNMNNNSSVSVNNSGYIGKLGEVISYIDHPVISIDDITIKHIKTVEQPATEQHVRLGDVETFAVSVVDGKSFEINWTSGAGELPGPSNFVTNGGCYELHVNVIEGEKLESIQGKLVLRKVSENMCSQGAKDLR